MMSQRLLRFVFCSLLLTVLGVTGAYAAPRHAKAEKPKQIVTEMEEQWRAATLAADAVALDKLLSDDYVGISWTGQVNTKAMQLERLRRRTLQLSRIDLDDVKIKVAGPVAIVTCSAHIEGINDGKEMNGIFRYTRIYQRQPSGQWKITNFEATRVPNPDRMKRNQPQT